ncbi:MAG: nucleoside transporter C-terminal domain-containing protein [Pseudomonadota bacterium]
MIIEFARAIAAIALLLFICWLMSTNRSAIVWRTVGMGIALQVLIAVVVLWSAPGQIALQALSTGITQVVNSARAGAEFVFGSGYEEHFIAFTIPATIIFFSLLMSLLYHLGVVQRLVGWMALGIRRILPVSGAESLAACANVFIGNTEAPLLVKPYIAKMTNSELMAMMTAGMATISGGMLAVYVGMGADAAYLITASLMAAPGALVVAKILVPESADPVTMAGSVQHAPSESINIFQAMTKGATDGLILAANVIAMLIAFVSLIALLNLILGALPEFNGAPLTLQRMLGWLFMPFAFMIGADWADAAAIGNLLGIKIFLTEFLAYAELQSLGDSISDKSRAVATFALCGFSSFISIGVQVGGIGALVPERRNDIAAVGFKCMIAGTLVTMLSATLASLFFT